MSSQDNDTAVFTDDQIKYLNDRLREQKKDLTDGRWWYFAMRLTSHMLVTLIPITILALLLTPVGDILGIRLDWFGPPSPSGSGDAELQPGKVAQSMRDMLTVIVPLFLGVAIWLVTVVAERRLKEYDATLDRFRDSNTKAFDDFRKEIREAEDRIGKRVEELVISKVVDRTQKSLTNLINKTRQAFSEETKESLKKLQQINNNIEARFGNLFDATTQLKGEGPLYSLGTVKDKARELFSIGQNADAINLVRQMLKAFESGRDDRSMRRPTGTLDDWFNLSAELGRRDQEYLALQVCFAGLEQQSGLPMPEGFAEWPDSLSPNYDLLAHAIKYAAEINAPELSSLLTLSGYDAETRRGREDWNWRSYTFVIDGLVSAGRTDEAIELAQAYLAAAGNNPDQQKVVTNLAGILSDCGRRAEASAILVKWLQDHPTLPAAQVVTRLIDLELGVAPSSRIVEWVNRGIRDLAEEQPTAGLGNLVYSRALAYDWQAHDAASRADQRAVATCARAALADYRLALQVGVNSALHTHIERRATLLRTLLGADGADDGTDGDTDDLSTSVKSTIQRILSVLATKDPNEACGLAASLLDRLPAFARGKVMEVLAHVAADEDFPPPLRSNIHRFIEQYGSKPETADRQPETVDS